MLPGELPVSCRREGNSADRAPGQRVPTPNLSGQNPGDSWPTCGSATGSIQEVDQLARFRKPKWETCGWGEAQSEGAVSHRNASIDLGVSPIWDTLINRAQVQSGCGSRNRGMSQPMDFPRSQHTFKPNPKPAKTRANPSVWSKCRNASGAWWPSDHTEASHHGDGDVPLVYRESTDHCPRVSHLERRGPSYQDNGSSWRQEPTAEVRP